MFITFVHFHQLLICCLPCFTYCNFQYLQNVPTLFIPSHNKNYYAFFDSCFQQVKNGGSYQNTLILPYSQQGSENPIWLLKTSTPTQRKIRLVFEHISHISIFIQISINVRLQQFLTVLDNGTA